MSLKNWKEEFNKFDLFKEVEYEKGQESSAAYISANDEVKEFIQQLLDEEKRKVKEEIKLDLEEYIPGDHETYTEFDKGWRQGFIDARNHLFPNPVDPEDLPF